MDTILHNLKHSVMITVFVFVMMIFIDYIEVLTEGKMSVLIRGGVFRQYFLSSFFGSVPGCLGSFMNVSFYIHGMISFGSIVGGMIATSGDEAFVMLSMFPEKALILFGLLFIIGIVFAFIVDKLAPILKIKPCRECGHVIIHPHDDCRSLDLKEIVTHIRKMSFIRFLVLTILTTSLYLFISGAIGPEQWNWKKITFLILIALAIFIVLNVPDHYFEEHIWNHIAKQHIWKVYLWTFGALLIVDIGMRYWDIDRLIHGHMLSVLLIASALAIIPESGPHLIIVTMFAKGLIPFSVLLASSIIQDGHGMLPLLSFSIKDSILIKLFNFVIGAGLGLIFYYSGY